MTIARPALFAGICTLLFAGYPRPAPCLGQQADGDGLYGRFDGDMVLSIGAGAGASLSIEPVYAAELRARYLDSAGLFVAPGWRPQSRAAIALGIELRPLFLARLFTGRFSGRSWFDLTLDSIGIELGTGLGPLDRGFGTALLAGGGIELPLGGKQSGARGLWLRVGARYLHASERYLQSPDPAGDDALFLALLVVRSTVDTGLAGWEPRRYTVP